MADRKYEFRNGQLWHRQGNYPVPDDEPLMVLRAKDPDAIYAIRAYIQRCSDVAKTGDDEALAHYEGAKLTEAEFEKFAREHPERIKRGCHKC